MTPVSISVIVPAYNAESCLRAAVDSALAQRLPPLEILVVDDGSSDQTAVIAQSYGPPVRCLRRANGGLPAARNTGLRAARGEWIALLDADDTWAPAHLAAQAELALQTGADLVFSDAEVVAPARHWESWLERSGHHWLLRRPGPVLERPLGLLVNHGSFVLPSSVLVRRQTVAAVGGFDETMRPGPEDLDLWLRLAPSTSWAFNRQSRIQRTEGAANLTGDGLGMATGAERLWRKALDTFGPIDPVLRRRMRDHLAQAQWEQAYFALWRGDARRARRAASRSLRTHWAWRPALYAAAACLPPVLVRRLRQRRLAASSAP